MNRLEDAVRNYHLCLTACARLEQPHLEATAHYNLAEAYAALKRQAEALEHWQRGYDLSQRAGFADEVQAFEQLRADTPLLQLQPTEPVQPAVRHTPATTTTTPPLPPDEQAILDLADTYGQLTAKLLTEKLTISRATATRRLGALTESGHLVQHGKGRGVYYTHSITTEAVSVTRTIPAAAELTGKELSTATLATLVTAHQSTLTERFGVTALIPVTERHAVPTSVFKVTFDTVPTLQEFWALRQYLTQIMDSEVDLQPML